MDRTTLGVGVAVMVAAGAAYLATAARDIVVGDTSEFIIAALTLGVAHAPGYPLVTMLGHLFSLIPVGPEAFRVNLMSVVFNTATVGVVYLTCLHLARNRIAAAAASLLLAFNPLFWTWSLVAETFPLNNLIAATLIYLLLLWDDQPLRMRLLVGAAFLAGLGMTNHQTIGLMGPAILYLLWHRRLVLMTKPQVVAACVGAIVLGLLPYAYIPWAAARGPLLNWRNVATVQDFVALLTRADYGGAQLVAGANSGVGSWLGRLWALVNSFALLEVVLIVGGAFLAYRLRRSYLWFVGLAFGITGPAFAAYANVDLTPGGALFVLERFFLLPHVILAPLAAVGAVHAVELASAKIPTVRAAQIRPAIIAAVLAWIAGGIITNYSAIDQSGNHVARTFAEDLLATLEPNSILLAKGDEAVLPAVYIQEVEGYRTDVTVVMLGLLPTDWYVRGLRARHADLSIPFAAFDRRTTSMKALVDANPGRTFSLYGENLDDSLAQGYWYYRRGLVARIEPMEKDLTVDQMISDYQALFARYRVPSRSSVKAGTFEEAILTQYALPANRIGDEYKSANLPDSARPWYEQSIAIAPNLPAAVASLARIDQGGGGR